MKRADSTAGPTTDATGRCELCARPPRVHLLGARALGVMVMFSVAAAVLPLIGAHQHGEVAFRAAATIVVARWARVDWGVRIELVIGNGEGFEKQRSGRECVSIPGRTPVWGLFVPFRAPTEGSRRAVGPFTVGGGSFRFRFRCRRGLAIGRSC